MRRVVAQFAGALALAATIHAAEFHVAVNGNYLNPGTRAKPLRTIQCAAEQAQPGDVITVHEGVYRERIHPPHGGTSHKQRIVFRAAPGEKVEIKQAQLDTKIGDPRALDALLDVSRCVSMTAADRLLALMPGVRRIGDDRWTARCPAHDDRSPSLSIRISAFAPGA